MAVTKKAVTKKRRGRPRAAVYGKRVSAAAELLGVSPAMMQEVWPALSAEGITLRTMRREKAKRTRAMDIIRAGIPPEPAQAPANGNGHHPSQKTAMPPEVLHEAAGIVFEMAQAIRRAGGTETARAAFELALAHVERGEMAASAR